MSSRTPLVHPFTFFIVNCVQIIWQDLAEGPTNTREALRDLYWLVCCLDAKGQEALKEEIATMESVFDGEQTIGVVQFRQLFKKAMKELHEEGYFLAAKMRPPTREKSMKDLELTIAEAKYGRKE